MPLTRAKISSKTHWRWIKKHTEGELKKNTEGELKKNTEGELKNTLKVN